MIERILGPRPYTLTDYVATFTVAAGPVLAFRGLPAPGRVVLLMVLPLAILGAAHLKRSLGAFPTWQWALIALLCLSVLWGDEPGYSTQELRTYIPLMLAIVFACSLMRPAQIIRALSFGFVVMLAWSAVLLVIDPRSHVRHGDFVLHAQFAKNTFGGILGLGLVLAVAKPRRANLIVVPLLAAAIALNYSVTAWIVTTVVALGSLGARWAARNLRATSIGPVLLITVLIGAAAFVLTVTLDSGSALDAVGKSSTLGSRTEIWAACWTEIKAAPLLGYGAFTFLNSGSLSPATLHIWAQFQGYHPPHPHNGFLDVWGQLGLVGLVVYFGMVFRALFFGTRMTLRGDPTARAGATCLIFILIFGATEPAYIGDWLSVVLPCSIACERSWAFRQRRIGSSKTDGRVLQPQGEELDRQPATAALDPVPSDGRGRPPFLSKGR